MSLNLSLQYSIPTKHNVNSIKTLSKDYFFYTQNNTIQLTSPSISRSISPSNDANTICNITTTLNYTGHNTTINSIDVLDTMMVSCSNNIQIHDIVKSGMNINTNSNNNNESNSNSSIRRFFTPDPFKINQVKFLNKDLIASCDDNSCLKIYDLRQEFSIKPIQNFINATDSLNCLDYYNHNDEYKLSTGCNDGKLYTYDLRMGLVLIDDFNTPITSITSVDGGDTGLNVLINCLEQDLILFNMTNKNTSYFPREKDSVYKVDNDVFKLHQYDNVYITGSEMGFLYVFHSQNETDQIRVQGTVISCMDVVDGHIVVGDDYGIEVLKIG